MEDHTNYSNLVTSTVSSATNADQSEHWCRPILGTYIPLGMVPFGVVTNYISFFILFKFKDSENPFNFLLRAMTMADGSYLLLYYVRYVLYSLYEITYSPILEPVYKLSVYIYADRHLVVFEYILYHLTWGVLAMVLIARYIAVCKPLKVKEVVTLKKVRIGICVLIVFCIVLSLPMYLPRDIVEFQNGNDTRVMHAPNEIGRNIYFNIFFMAVCQIFGPRVFTGVVIVYTNYNICREIWRAKSKRKQMVSSANKKAKETGITAALILNSVIKLVSEIFISSMVFIGFMRFEVNQTVSMCARWLANIVYDISYCINIILFMICCQEFREILFRCFSKKK